MMSLQRIQNALYQSDFGALLADGAGISEPIPLPAENGLVQNFFFYMVDREGGFFSAPFAWAGILPEEKRVVSFTSCYDEPFSRSPEEILKAEASFDARSRAYADYESKYNAAEPLFYKDCSASGREIVRDYLQALERVTDPVMYPFYAEMAPTFFDWVNSILDGKEGK